MRVLVIPPGLQKQVERNGDSLVITKSPTLDVPNIRKHASHYVVLPTELDRVYHIARSAHDHVTGALDLKLGNSFSLPLNAMQCLNLDAPALMRQEGQRYHYVALREIRMKHIGPGLLVSLGPDEVPQELLSA